MWTICPGLVLSESLLCALCERTTTLRWMCALKHNLGSISDRCHRLFDRKTRKSTTTMRCVTMMKSYTDAHHPMTRTKLLWKCISKHYQIGCIANQRRVNLIDGQGPRRLALLQLLYLQSLTASNGEFAIFSSQSDCCDDFERFHTCFEAMRRFWKFFSFVFLVTMTIHPIM